jgi:heme exporter protein C
VFSAIFGIFAYLDVPLVYFSIRLFRTQHPQPVVLGGSGSGLNPTMRGVLLFCWIALLGLMLVLVRQRYRLERLRHEAGELRFAIESRAASSDAAGKGRREAER